VFNCSDGSNIYPSFIELRLENESFIRQAVLLGDRRPFIAALVVADRRRIAESLKREAAALSDDEVESAVWTQIERVNSHLEHYERIRRIMVMNVDFPTEVRSVNVFQKVKVERSAVAESYAREIEALYSSDAEGVHR
jgi:long-chain acyl-CoA synthetase